MMWRVPASALLLLLSILFLAIKGDQSHFQFIVTGFSLGFISYFQLLYVSHNTINLRNGILFAVLLRLILIPFFPLLSDDIYRFFWDGALIDSGINPYVWLPTEIPPDSIPNQIEIFEQLNSPNYYSVYPPVSQLIFFLAYKITGADLLYYSMVLKIIFISFEIGIFYFGIKILRILRLPKVNILLYALNPLVILEGVGNLHFEILMIFFLYVAIFFSIKKLPIPVVLGGCLSVGTKLISAIIWPFLYGTLKKRKFLLYSTGLFLVGILIMYPVWGSDAITYFASSLDLYFRKFEFNGSIYALFRWVGIQWNGYNTIHIIGPMLQILSALLIGYLVIKSRRYSIKKSLSQAVYALLVYYLFATTVHPWYIILIISLSILTPMRTPLVWSAVIWLSYAHYSMDKTYSIAFIIVEYFILFLFAVYELKIKLQRNNKLN